MKLSDIYPFPVFIDWEGSQIELKPFSLRAITWAERFFAFKDDVSGMDRMYKILSGKEGSEILTNTVIDIVYYLGEPGFSKNRVNSSTDLKKIIAESDEKLKIITGLREAIENVFINSFPEPSKQPAENEISGGAIFEFLKKQNAEREDDSKDESWDQIYIDFYRDGGMTIDQFYDLTKRQIAILYPELIYKKSIDYKLQVEMHGQKLKYNPKRRAS